MAKKKKVLIKEKYGSRGFLKEVKNPKGKKPSVYIYQGYKSGFSAKYVKSGRSMSGSSRDAEALARRLARKGHKRVTFR